MYGTWLKSLSETHCESGVASGPVDDHSYDEGRAHDAPATVAEASNATPADNGLRKLFFAHLIVMYSSSRKESKRQGDGASKPSQEDRQHRRPLALYIPRGSGRRLRPIAENISSMHAVFGKRWSRWVACSVQNDSRGLSRSVMRPATRSKDLHNLRLLANLILKTRASVPLCGSLLFPHGLTYRLVG